MVEYANYEEDAGSDNGGWDGFDYEMNDESQPISFTRLDSNFEGGPKLTRGFSFKIIHQDEINPLQDSMIIDTIDTLGVSDCVARSLLINY
jgi:hypothetical protein